MLATGTSQLAFLARARRGHAARPIDWSRVTGFHMDEYVGLPPTHPASFQRYMRERVAAYLPFGAFHYIDGDAPDPDAEAARYATLLEEHPVDVCCLGIGENGHLAFNDPPVADFDDPLLVKVVELDDRCKLQQVGEGHFATARRRSAARDHGHRAGPAARPPRARDRARGPQGRAGAGRARRVRSTTACPASILRRQAHAMLYLDSRVGVAAHRAVVSARPRPRCLGGARRSRVGASSRRRLPPLLRRHLADLARRSSLSVRAHLGLAPWDVFHQGVSKRTGLSLGWVIVVVGFVVLLAWIPLHQRFGIGTIINTVLVGTFVKVFLPHDRNARRDGGPDRDAPRHRSPRSASAAVSTSAPRSGPAPATGS